MADNKFKKSAKRELKGWIEEQGLDLTSHREGFGKVWTIQDRLSICVDPWASSSEELRRAQTEAHSDGRTLYFLYPWDGDLKKLFSHFASKLSLDERKFAAKRLSLGVIDNRIADAFMIDHHIQGSARGTGKVSIGLADPSSGEILAVQQFSRYRFGGTRGAGSVKESPVWEGLRLCFKPGIQIHGGATRMQRFFEAHWRPERIVSYVSASHSTGEYKRLQGFDIVQSSRSEAYYWVLGKDPKAVEIIDRDGKRRLPDLDRCRANPWLNPARIAGAFGKGVGETFYGGRLGSRSELRAHSANGSLVHNDVILEAIGYERQWTPGQYRWEKEYPSNSGIDRTGLGDSAPALS